ncbi:hypothetical protein GCM10023192_07750 [Amycolatopsis samaneae]
MLVRARAASAPGRTVFAALRIAMRASPVRRVPADHNLRAGHRTRPEKYSLLHPIRPDHGIVPDDAAD